MTAVLFSMHEEVARIPVENIGELHCTLKPQDPDLIKVICYDREVYWCDSIEFLK